MILPFILRKITICVCQLVNYCKVFPVTHRYQLHHCFLKKCKMFFLMIINDVTKYKAFCNDACEIILIL